MPETIAHAQTFVKNPDKHGIKDDCALRPLIPDVGAILEADKRTPSKKRLTAKRIFERLRIEHGYVGGLLGCEGLRSDCPPASP